MSTGPNAFLVITKAALTVVWSEILALIAGTETQGCGASTAFLVERRVDSVRPMMTIFAEPDLAKAWVSRGTSPPVMKTTLPAVESSGWVLSMEGWGELWKMLV
jgi:hypothetical protein